MCSRRWLLPLAAIACVALTLTTRSATPVYFPDDPAREDFDRALDASKAVRIEGSNAYDFAEQTFIKPAERRPIQAVNVNTIDEVPDSSWFTNRIGRLPGMSVDEIVRGPNTLDALNIDDWPVIEGKSSGITPGYRVVAPDGRLYQVKFDPPSNPEMASGAEVIGAAFYHAIGYNVVQGYIVEVDPARIVIAPNATTVDLRGRKVPITRTNVDRLLRVAAKLPNGKYRATLSRFADGKPLGYFKYYGTRPDDPNDIHPHEHRRELRSNRVFAAWLNHDDSRGLNSLDMLEGEAPGRQWIRHYMFDFGSIMGSGSTTAQVPRAGNEYILEWGPGFKTLATLGIYVRPWILVDYWEGAKSVGRFEGDFFDPVQWRPEYPNPAFDNMTPQDAFWAARLVSKFSDEVIRAVVAKARYSEPGAAEHIATTLIKRRDKVLRAWLTGVNPLVNAQLLVDGGLMFENAAVEAGIATAPSEYRFTWSRFDNATGATSQFVDGTTVGRTNGVLHGVRIETPEALLDSAFLSVSIRSIHADYPAWSNPVTFTFRRNGTQWETVGLDRTSKSVVQK
ncbi:MAG TPA: hypothetical protein VKA59_00020 [Vicinamibacterales bacterium]|nr:hypothetical protein [Vicinamibacterales bacterium]